MRKNIKLRNIILIGLSVAVLLFSWIRLYFGVEISDEAFYVAEPYIVSQGAIPIVNNWTQSPTFSIITAPLVYLYYEVMGDMEGIMLFMRFAYNLFKLLVSVIIFVLLNKHIQRSVIIMYLIPFMLFTPYSIPSLSYNTLSLVLQMLSGVFIIAAFLEKNRRHRQLHAMFAGVAMALSVLSYPVQIVTCIVACIIILVLERKQFNSFDIIMAYCISGLCVALIATSVLFIKGGGIGNFLTGFRIMLYDNPYFLLTGNIIGTNLQSIIRISILFIVFLIIELTVLIGFAIKNHIKGITINKQTIRKTTVLSLVVVAMTYVVIINILGYKSNNILNYLCAVMFPLPIILMFAIEEKKEIYSRLIWFIWLPSLIWLISSTVFAYGGINYRYYALFAGTLLSIPFSAFALDEISTSSKTICRLKYVIIISLTMLFALSFGIDYYTFVYRDRSIPELNYKINSGIYHGMYTTRERGMAIEVLESELKEHTKDNETVLFMETVPMAYLMSKAIPCTPSTWDVTLYSYGFNDDTLYRKYFDITDKIPDKIIYIYTRRDKVLSIDKKDHKFNNFVNKNYKLIYKSDEPLFYIKVYKRNNA